MNRALILGIAMFLAIVGIALVGADNTAVAGHGCSCSCGGCGCGGCGCGGGLLGRLFHGCHGCHGCGGYSSCCAPAACEPACCEPACCEPACSGCEAGGYHEAAPAGAPPAEAAPAAPAAPPAPAAYKRAPFGFRQVTFRR